MPSAGPGTILPPSLVPGHPEDPQDTAGPMVPESAWRRFRAWHMQAPAERLPLTGIAVTWPAAWLMHLARVRLLDAALTAAAVTVLAWLVWTVHTWRYRRALDAGRPARLRFLPGEAACVAAAAGGWVTAAVHWGPLSPPGCWPTVTYLAVAYFGYRWLRRHPAVQDARDQREAAAELVRRKTWWHLIAHLIGLGGFDLVNVIPTLLGEQLLLTSSPGSRSGRASQIAAHPDGVAENLLHHLGMDYGNIDITTPKPGWLLVDIRYEDPSIEGPVRHPMIDPGSRFADLFPAVASVRDPVPLLVVPETAEVASIALWDENGGKVIGVYAAGGQGKTTILNDFRERITAMDDAVLLQANGAKVGDELAWADLAAGTAAGSVLADEPAGTCDKILAVLQYGQQLITDRSATHVITGDSVFQPTPEDPAVIIELDEIDEILKIPGAQAAIEFLASKRRSSAVSLILASQRAVQQWTGGGGVRANLTDVLIGNMTRASESRHATGAEHDMPDISEYSKGEPGYFQHWKPMAKRVVARGRAFDIGTIGEQQRNIIWQRDPAARPALPGPGLDLDSYGQPGQAQDVDDSSRLPVADDPDSLRGRLARAVGLLPGGNQGRHAKPAGPPPPPSARAAPARAPRMIPGVPAHAAAKMLLLLEKGTTATEFAAAIGTGKTKAYEYLVAARKRGVAVTAGSGPATRWLLAGNTTEAGTPGPDPEPVTRPYGTIEMLADAVAGGLVECDDDTREMLLKARELAGQERPRKRGHLTLLPTGTGDGDPADTGAGDER